MGVLSTSTSYPRQPLVDWDLISEPQAGAGGKRTHYARGKTLGGSSALNTMGYLRGSVGTHQRWADLVGDDSYTWENVLPYFKKSTTFTPPNLAKRFPENATVHYDPTAFDNSLIGPIQISYGNWMDVTTTWLAVALQSIGMPLGSLGFNSGVLSGFGGWTSDEINPEDATRSSSEAGYLRQAIANPNSAITVYTHTQASKILFDTNKTANGVLVNTAGFEYTISATKEVILSAGVFHSPQLLMLSGTFPINDSIPLLINNQASAQPQHLNPLTSQSSPTSPESVKTSGTRFSSTSSQASTSPSLSPRPQTKLLPCNPISKTKKGLTAQQAATYHSRKSRKTYDRTSHSERNTCSPRSPTTGRRLSTSCLRSRVRMELLVRFLPRLKLPSRVVM